MRLGLLKKLFARERLPAQLRYEDARSVLEGQSATLKRELAAREDAPPETLYYLAGDADPEIRSLVAANPATPIQADELLRDDGHEEVRAELARKIARMVPDMPEGERAELHGRAMRLLERLARDELVRVRQIVAEEIKACTNIPRRIVSRLARDAELVVCGPVLEYSPLLSDEDLLEIIATTRVEGALEAIARRAHLSGDVTDAIVVTLEVPAIARLLANPSAEIREESLDRIISEAASFEAWHLPLVMRPELSLRAVRRIAVFASRALIEELRRHHRLDAETADYLRQRAQARIEEEDDATPTPDAVLAAIRKAHARGRLTDDVVTKAASLQHKSAVVLALTLRTGVPEALVAHVIEAKSGKAIAALCWKAGFVMRTALAIETFVANVPVENRVLPRGGVDYPMSEDEMIWHLQYFGIEA